MNTNMAEDMDGNGSNGGNTVDDVLDEFEIEIESEASLLRKRITFTLQIYPRVSPSMLQAAIGPHHAARDWRPILEQMIREGIVHRGQESHFSERGRWRTIVVLSLTNIDYSSFAHTHTTHTHSTSSDDWSEDDTPI